VKSVRFHPDAEAEFIASSDFYETQAAGLRLDFVAEVHQRRERLLLTPRAVIGSPNAFAASSSVASRTAFSTASNRTRSTSLQ